MTKNDLNYWDFESKKAGFWESEISLGFLKHKKSKNVIKTLNFSSKIISFTKRKVAKQQSRNPPSGWLEARESDDLWSVGMSKTETLSAKAD